MKIFLAGGVQGNLKPLWKMIAHGKGWDEGIACFLGRNRESALDTDPYD
jgi:hypothetical protein